MNLRFSIVAEAEIQAAADYYESQEAGLGSRFVEELNRAIKLILQFPNAWSPLSKRSRRCPLRHFPYHVIYSGPYLHDSNFSWYSGLHSGSR
jgi:hypothetical protein